MSEQILETTMVYDGRLIRVEKRLVLLPGGARATREIVLHPGAAAIVAIDGDGCVLLVRQYRSAAGEVLLEIPAGTRDAAEPLLDCAARELREETGYAARQLRPLGVMAVSPGYATERIELFLASELVPDPLTPDADEAIELVRMPLAHALDAIERGDIIDSKTQVGLLRAARVLSIG
jgi:ADP-ribose pyrophosphatase